MNDYRDEEYTEPKKKKRFRLFDSQREGKGVSKDEKPITPDLGGFFRSFKRNFSSLLRVNLFMVIGNFPILFAILGLSGLFKIPYMTPLSNLFPNLRSLMLLDPSRSPATMALYGVFGGQIENTALTPMSYVMFGLSALTFLTFGFVCVGTTYILRSLVRGEPVFMWADFFYAIKRNKKQAFFFGMLDLLLLLLIPFNFTVLSEMTGGGLMIGIIFWLTVVFAVIYFFMRFYIYLQMITFDLSIGKILKNSFIFSLLGFKRNILALLGMILLFFLDFILLFGLGGILLPLGIAAPLVIIFSAASYMAVFAAWYKIKDLMIPEGADQPPEDGAEEPSEP